MLHRPRKAAGYAVPTATAPLCGLLHCMACVARLKKENTLPVRDFVCEISSFLRHFDNVVKEYTYLFGNVLISVACAELYPDKFELNATVVLSLALLFVGIYVYEEKRVKNEGPREGSVKIM